MTYTKNNTRNRKSTRNRKPRKVNNDLHSKSTCTCGRTIHFPKNARFGYKWTCNSCGRTWVLSRYDGSGTPCDLSYSKTRTRQLRNSGY